MAALVALAAATLAACGNGTDTAVSSPQPSEAAAAVELTAEEQAYLQEKGALKVGAFNDYPPFGFVDESGSAAGIAVDYWNQVAGLLGVTVEFSPVQFSAQLDGLKQGQFDSLQGIFPLPEREQWFAFSDPYLVINTRIFVAAQHTDATTLASLKEQGLVVAVVKDDSGQAIADQAGLTTKVVAGYPEAVDAVVSGAAQAMILDELVAGYFIAQRDLVEQVVSVGEPVDHGEMTLPVQKDDAVLLGILNKAVAALDGEGDALKAEWLAQQAQ